MKSFLETGLKVKEYHLKYSVWKALTDEKGKKSHFETSVVVKVYIFLSLKPPNPP